ncbi:Superfamily II DNA and RNA helicase [Pseudoxanthobacter soli DSM 19599]|uniref:DEAD-box ATP-dependent RNA helicase RhpA n=1 Tax=Pseudoxanthobacter soli DSM 19599 TaxID=1123029 RepID=A0A1M7Z8L6_9HYPH|nr:DEAD/DEAH box helicase [Pseudoxanthobacter soli]SHO61056.1 Superfamily II DNA and RNA helicase [Pseudoxanthobacter soli DSM 19599]
MSFDSLGLSDKVLAAVTAAGYREPTPIQAGAIPHVLERRDVLGIAQTGTGKTASFTLPMLTLLEHGRARARMPRTLILEPTRELAAQVEENFSRYGVNHKLTVALLIGGVSFDEQDRKLGRGADVLIATPGRLLDHVERGKLLLQGVEVLVIDEADRMLDMGFIPDIERISKLIPFTRQTLFFSATMPPEIQRLADKFLQNPVKVEVSRAASTADTVTQQLISSGSEPHEKRSVLRHLIRNAENLKNAIIFCNRKRDVQTVFHSLQRHGFSVGALHGDMDQHARMAMLDGFRKGNITLLVASDVAARGLDIPDVSHVFNFDVPHHSEDYVHRIGRTGRAGRSGVAVTIVTPADSKLLTAIEKLIAREIPWIESPAPPADDGEEPRAERRGRSRRGAKTAKTAAPAPEADAEAIDAPAKPARAPRPKRGEKRAAKTADETAAPQALAPAPREQAPREQAARDQAPRERAPRDQAPREQSSREPVRQGSSSSRDRQHNRRDRQDRDDPPVIGLGDHVPAFLLRPVRLPKPSKVEEMEDEETFEDAEIGGN